MAKAKDPTETASPVLPTAEPKGDLVEVTVTKFGSGLVSTGQRDETGDIFASRGDKLFVSKATAKALETLGYAESE
jgi:hypothetical protein